MLRKCGKGSSKIHSSISGHLILHGGSYLSQQSTWTSCPHRPVAFTISWQFCSVLHGCVQYSWQRWPRPEMLECGHQCSGTCSSCSQGRLHVPCTKKCNRILVCGHICTDYCNYFTISWQFCSVLHGCVQYSWQRWPHDKWNVQGLSHMPRLGSLWHGINISC
jgi:hypothetical protein